jgi:KDO2-lipid IV(A) lauroyltransferase
MPSGEPPVTDAHYRFQASPRAPERLYTLTPGHLEWQSGGRHGRLAYDEIGAVEVFKSRFWGASATYWTCVLTTRAGQKIRLSAANRVGFRKVEDRTPTYIPFIKELEARIASANPDAGFVIGQHWLGRLESFAGRIGVLVFRAFRRLDLDRTTDALAAVMRRLGPRLRGSRTARAQLQAAFPEKTPAELAQVLDGMWDNLARVVVEYAHLDTLCGHASAGTGRDRVVLHESTIRNLAGAHTHDKPILVFSAHLSNWELIAPCALSAGREIGLVYRKHPIGPLEAEIAKARGQLVTALFPAGPRTTRQVRDALRRKWIVGMLIDQHYAGGVDVTFFGRTCKVNPMLARYARMFDCAVHGARIVRLPDRRFLYEVTDPLTLPRDPGGNVDVPATMQMATSLIERWVREHPEQWMWLHKRWR